MKATIINMAPVTLSVTTIFVIFVLLWSYSIDLLFPPIDFGPRTGDLVPPEVYAGQQAQICRDITFHRPLSMDLSRSMIQRRPNGATLELEFGAMQVARSAGRVSQCRIIEIPEGLPPGKWELHTWVSFESWPFWHRRLEAPVASVVVKPY